MCPLEAQPGYPLLGGEELALQSREAPRRCAMAPHTLLALLTQSCPGGQRDHAAQFATCEVVAKRKSVRAVLRHERRRQGADLAPWVPRISGRSVSRSRHPVGRTRMTRSSHLIAPDRAQLLHAYTGHSGVVAASHAEAEATGSAMSSLGSPREEKRGGAGARLLLGQGISGVSGRSASLRSYPVTALSAEPPRVLVSDPTTATKLVHAAATAATTRSRSTTPTAVGVCSGAAAGAAHAATHHRPRMYPRDNDHRSRT